jgi:hypothetical protein
VGRLDSRPPAPDPGDDEADDVEGEEAADKDDVGRSVAFDAASSGDVAFSAFGPLPSRLRPAAAQAVASQPTKKGKAPPPAGQVIFRDLHLGEMPKQLIQGSRLRSTVEI